MEIFKKIIEIIFSPFTILYRSKPVNQPNKSVNVFIVVAVSLVITCAILFLVYYERLF